MKNWFRFGKSNNNNLAIGIDFGTTMSRITYVQSGQVFFPPEIPSVPSIVSASPIHGRTRIKWKVGDAALENINKSRIKLEIGAMKPIYENEGLNFRPEVLAGRIIYELRKKAEGYNNLLKDIKDVTVTVPAEWSILNRTATIFAAKIAGFQNVNLIEEPIAAYLAIEQFMKQNVSNAKKILVFDCGGGTLDVTIIINEPGKLPFAAGRITDEIVAGENIDDALAKNIVGEIDWRQLDLNQRRDLSRQVKKLKEALNPINISDDPLAEAKRNEKTYIGNIKDKQMVLPLDLHNQVVKKIVTQAKEYLDSALLSCYINGKHEHLNSEDINCIILVGGSSYLRPLQKVITEYFKKSINQIEIILFRPEDLVAIGAALWQSYLQSGEEKFQPTLSMRTYLLAKELKGGSLVDTKYLLGQPGDVLPREASNGLSGYFIEIPKEVKEINWKVYQDFAYSDKHGAVPVGWINYEGKISGLENIRLDYLIDKNGILARWKPSLVFAQGNDITPPFRSQYNWDNDDTGDDPESVARKYYVRYDSN